MPLPQHSLIIFDLDGTLAQSKMPLDAEMASLILELLTHKHVAVISGGTWRQFETQFLTSLPNAAKNFTNLYLLPTSGTKLYTWKGSWHEEYRKEFTNQQKEKIMSALKSALLASGYKEPKLVYGQIIEDRESQITFSGLGQQAPIALKSAWDPERLIRNKIVALLEPKIPEFDVRMGGTTSIDITLRGVNKAYGIRQLEKFLGIEVANILFIGDALYQGGNDYPARATGADCIQVKGPEEVKELIRGWLSQVSPGTTETETHIFTAESNIASN